MDLNEEKTAEYWNDRAEEAQLQAETMTHAPAKRGMLQVAAVYRRLAQFVRDRTRRREPVEK